MQPDRNIKLTPDLWFRMAAVAEAEGRSVDERLEEAALRLLQPRELRSSVAKNRELAEQRGLTEADVPRLISETREAPPAVNAIPRHAGQQHPHTGTGLRIEFFVTRTRTLSSLAP